MLGVEPAGTLIGAAKMCCVPIHAFTRLALPSSESWPEPMSPLLLFVVPSVPSTSEPSSIVVAPV